MIPKKPAPDLIRGGHRFSDKITLIKLLHDAQKRAPMNLPKRDWMDMIWQEIADAGGATARWIAVLPLAAVEQHGPHLPLGVDTFIAEAYLARVREILPDELAVSFLPVQRFGVSVEHIA